MQFLITASSAFEAEIVCSRLREAGIEPLWQGSEMPRSGEIVMRDIYVEDDELERAKQVLAEAEDFDEEELIRLSEGKDAAGDG
jgi:Putative prokaryotic signal transducing protein